MKCFSLRIKVKAHRLHNGGNGSQNRARERWYERAERDASFPPSSPPRLSSPAAACSPPPPSSLLIVVSTTSPTLRAPCLMRTRDPLSLFLPLYSLSPATQFSVEKGKNLLHAHRIHPPSSPMTAARFHLPSSPLLLLPSLLPASRQPVSNTSLILLFCSSCMSFLFSSCRSSLVCSNPPSPPARIFRTVVQVQRCLKGGLFVPAL